MKIDKQYRTKIEPLKLFGAWVSEDMVIEPATKIESKPEVGGHYRLYAAAPPNEFVMHGEFKEVDWGKKLVYSWHWQGTDETTLITVEFEESETGTIVNLSHEGFLTQESLDNHNNGWDSYFKGLEARLFD